jgi:uncharacterized protein YjfI (DUF2170 family)
MATAAQLKAERIAAADEARTVAYQEALVAPAKTQKQIDIINAGVQAATEASGNVYDPATAMTVDNQVSINPEVKTTENYSTGTRVDTLTPVPKSIGGLSDTDKDAYALLKEVFIKYGLEELVPAITKLMANNVGPNQASLMLKTNPEYNAAYIKRFAGNESRRKAGLNVLSEAEYIDLENSYSQTLNAYGLKNYFGATTDAKRTAMANIIGSDISATEFKERVDTVVTRVNNADPKIKETLKNFYGIKEEDLTSYFLNPTDNLPKLQEKVTAAEIGAAAANQNLAYNKTSAEDLAKFGITKAQAQEGYSTVGEIMPTASKLGDIYGDQYTQATAEQEVFKGTASAKRKRQQLAEREVASFSGSSGAAQGAFSTSYLKKSSAAGQI